MPDLRAPSRTKQFSSVSVKVGSLYGSGFGQRSKMPKNLQRPLNNWGDFSLSQLRDCSGKREVARAYVQLDGTISHQETFKGDGFS
jgi:hypothetical protein